MWNVSAAVHNQCFQIVLACAKKTRQQMSRTNFRCVAHWFSESLLIFPCFYGFGCLLEKKHGENGKISQQRVGGEGGGQGVSLNLVVFHLFFQMIGRFSTLVTALGNTCQ